MSDRILCIENYRLGPSTHTYGRRPDEVERIVTDAVNACLGKVIVSADEIVTFTSRVEGEVLAALAAIN